MPNTNLRAEWMKAVDEIREEMKTCDNIEILSGPCAGMVIKGENDIREYAKRLDEWMFPPEARAMRAPRPLSTPKYAGP